MRAYPMLADFLIVVLVWRVWKKGWDSLVLTNQEWDFLKALNERQLAATAIQNQAVAAMTVVSIIFVAIGALLAQGSQVELEAKRHLRAAALLCFVSLALGVWIIASLPVQVNFYNVAYDHWLALFSISQVAVTFLAALRILLGMWRLLA